MKLYQCDKCKEIFEDSYKLFRVKATNYYDKVIFDSYVCSTCLKKVENEAI